MKYLLFSIASADHEETISCFDGVFHTAEEAMDYFDGNQELNTIYTTASVVEFDGTNWKVAYSHGHYPQAYYQVRPGWNDMNDPAFRRL